jgi:hypothetical protein
MRNPWVICEVEYVSDVVYRSKSWTEEVVAYKSSISEVE